MIQFSSEEYDLHLEEIDESWSKEETVYLWNLLEKYHLRFFVVFDR